jgi:thiamine-phosphate pyrophosphorylase
VAAQKKRWSGFYFITDAGLSVNGHIEDVRQALEAGSAMVQYREKNKPYEERIKEARAIQELCKKAGVPFIVNDDVELAKDISADGVHVGQEDMAAQAARKIVGPDAILGVSVEKVGQAKAAIEAGADYLGVGAIFLTDTKPDIGEPIGIQGLRQVRAMTDLPIAAIGGIGKKNANQVLEAGADMICAISAVLASGRVRENFRELMGR